MAGRVTGRIWFPIHQLSFDVVSAQPYFQSKRRTIQQKFRLSQSKGLSYLLICEFTLH